MEISSNTICLTVDVEWAHPEVLDDLRRQFDERGLRATFFCTHQGVSVPGHERGLHPNFRRNGDTVRKFRGLSGTPADTWIDTQVYEHVVSTTKEFCPEAIGVRGHSLFYDSELLAIYQRAGIEYDSSCCMPLMEGLRPIWKEYGILEIPVYYIDHFDLKAQRTGFSLQGLRLEQPGLKVFDFHPNIAFINATSNADYLACKDFYHDPERLLKFRRPGHGTRTLMLELLDEIAVRKLPTATMGELNSRCRSQAPQAHPETAP
ncbi:MAG TPA: hypothetical protein VMU16_09020 [Candidatus Binataceae bacterium]|nr:hypothetical protein [Candidatus Binataceae bacterium]